MRKSILILGHSYATQFIDIFNQYTRLFDRGQYEVTVAYLTGEPRKDIEERTIAEHVVFINASKKSIRGMKLRPILTLLSLCRKNKFDMVICHRYKPSYIMMWVAQFCKINALVFVMHELGTMAARGRQLLIAALVRKNMLFAGVSNAVRDNMRASLWCVPKERVVTLYNMIDVELTEPQLFTREQARRALQIPDGVFLFGNLARLVQNKDHSSLIEAFAQVKACCPKAKLMIIGDGVLETELKEQVSTLQLDKEVIFTGYIVGAYRYMHAFDSFVLSSTQEAFGRVLLEAMIAKLPIIATKTHGIPEVLGDAGMIVNPRNVDELTSAMKNIYNMTMSEREALGNHAYARMQANFSIPIFHQQFWQLPLIQSIKD